MVRAHEFPCALHERGRLMRGDVLDHHLQAREAFHQRRPACARGTPSRGRTQSTSASVTPRRARAAASRPPASPRGPRRTCGCRSRPKPNWWWRPGVVLRPPSRSRTTWPSRSRRLGVVGEVERHERLERKRASAAPRGRSRRPSLSSRPRPGFQVRHHDRAGELPRRRRGDRGHRLAVAKMRVPVVGRVISIESAITRL